MSLLRAAKRFLYHQQKKHILKVERSGERGFASHGQDLFVAETLRDVAEGVFVEIGANDGVKLSNTYYFEQLGNWTGIAIEPLPTTYKKLQANRTCVTVHGCVCDYDGETSFLAIEGACEMLSGMPDRYDRRHERRIRKNLKRHAGVAREIVVPCFTLSTLLARHDIRRVDYLSVDTEGGELEILRSIDFAGFEIDVISVENNYYDPAIEAHLAAQGYALIAIAGVDEIYRKQPALRIAA